MSQWQPIETAPKDGTEVLLCQATDADGKPILDESWGIFVQVAAWWRKRSNLEAGEWTVYCSQIQEPRLHFTPTHWMPLPSNPLAPAGSESAAYLEASRTLGRNALVEIDAPDVIAAARAVCDAETGVHREEDAP